MDPIVGHSTPAPHPADHRSRPPAAPAAPAAPGPEGVRPGGRRVVVSLLLYAVAAAVMFAPWPGLVAAVDRSCGQPPLDVRGGWTAAEARALLAACGETGRAAYLHLQLADLVYPGVTALALALSARWLWARLGRARPGWVRLGASGWLIAAPALLAGLLDYAENVVIWSLLVRWPGSPGMLAEVGGAVTSAKRVVATVAFVIPLVLGGALAWRRLRTRRHTQG